MTGLRRLAAIAAALFVVAMAGCQTVSESKENFRPLFEKPKLTPKQLRMLLNDFTVRFALQVEGAADRIQAVSESPDVCRHALSWKIYGISACLLASSRTDALGALGDVTILTLQMRQYFESGAGRDLFGPEQEAAVDLSRDLEQQILEIRDLLSDDKAGLEKGLALMRAFVEQHPLTDITFVRTSVYREYLGLTLRLERGLVETFGSMSDVMEGLSELLTFQLNHLPKRIRWEAELLLQETNRTPSVAALLDRLGALETAADGIAQVIRDLPSLVHHERKTVLDAVTVERKETVRDVEKTRDEMVAQVDRMRVATIDRLREERRIVVGELHGEISGFAAALDEITARRVEEGLTGARGLLGKALVAGALGGTVLTAVLLGVAFILRGRR